MPALRIIAITGGIGSGKSVVSALLRTIGYCVYDCDERAKHVMTHDMQLRDELCHLFGPETYDGPCLNKAYLASRIFGNDEMLRQMNACVHPAVARDIMRCYDTACAAMAGREADHAGLFFYESAILYESGFDQLVVPDEVWTVSAPLELRISRAMQRDGCTRDQVIRRIDAQLPQHDKEQRADRVIINDGQHAVIPQVRQILAEY